MASPIKRSFKRNTRNLVLKGLSRFGLALHRLFENRNYDMESNGEWRVIQKLNLQNGCVIDAGANRGHYSQLVHRTYPACRIYAIEPHGEAFKELQSAFINTAQVETLELGLWSESGERTFYQYDESEHTSARSLEGMDKRAPETFVAPVLTGDMFMQQQGIASVDFLKIDVEGGELEVMKGFRKAFTSGKIKACQFEYGYANISHGALLYDIYQFLQPLGYTIGKVYPKWVDFRDYHVKHEDFMGPNYLAVHTADKELIKLMSK